MYFLSYLLVVTGVIVFVIKPTPITSTSRGYYRCVLQVVRGVTGGERKERRADEGSIERECVRA